VAQKVTPALFPRTVNINLSVLKTAVRLFFSSN